MRVKTLARISKAARRAVKTAQLSSENNQPFRRLRDTAFVLIILSFSLSTHGMARNLMLLRVAVPKCFADFLKLLRCYAANNHQRRPWKSLFARQVRDRGPANLLLRPGGMGHNHARQVTGQPAFAQPVSN